MSIEVDGLVHTSIRASAGSGKTYQLANRYLQLFAAGVAPGSMLASTFTRQAAGEIRDRILNDLAAAANDRPAREKLATRLGMKSLSRPAVLDLLAALARSMHVLQIRTLDSFFAAVVQSFAIELELPTGAAIISEEQARQLRSQAIRLMLDERKPQEMIDLLRLLTRGESDRGVTGAIDRVVSGLYTLWRETTDEAWDCVPLLEGRLTHAAVVEAIQALESCAIPATSKSLHKAWLNDVAKARARDWHGFIKNGIAAKVAGQTTFNRAELDPCVIEAYQPLVNHAAAELVHRTARQTVATRDLLKLFHEQYQSLKRRRRVLTFDDLTAAMIGAREYAGGLDDIGFRLDARLHHLLLDEFQDTAIAQWRVLEPIVREIICVAPPERTFFCVGDVKQSIYGWRDAAPEVLDELPRLLRGPDGGTAITQRELARSYRSSQPVIDVVNSVFQSLVRNESLADFADAAAVWQAGFKPHDTERTELAGYVELRVTRGAAEGEKNEHIRLGAAADLVADLHRANPNLEVAVLLRTNEAVARMLYELGPSRRNIRAGGLGGGPLTDAAPVNAILDLLRLADHPDDTIAAFNVASSPLGRSSAVGLTDFCDRSMRHRVARRVRRALLNDGYAATIAGWVGMGGIAGECDGRELRRLLQLVELAGEFDRQSTLRPGDFVTAVECTAVADDQPAAVRVMTIHKSKGLEFDAVVLPELDWQLIGQPPPVVFDRRGETGPIEHICRYMNKETRAFVPALDGLFDRHRRRAVRESLCLLYVAMTRAKHGLYMLIDPLTGPPTKTAEGILRCALAEGNCDADQAIFTHGDAAWPEKVKSPEETPTSDEPSITTIRLAKTSEADLAARGLAAAAASAHALPARLQFALTDDEARHRGLALHALFQQIEWIEEYQSDEDDLLSAARAAAPRRDEDWARALVKSYLAMIQNSGKTDKTSPSAAWEALSRGGRDRSTFFSLHREHPFARLIDGRVQLGSIDRLVVEHDGAGRPVAATIIDFKTDEVDAADAPARAQAYRDQLEAYRQVVAESFRIDPASIRMKVLMVVAGAAVDL